VPVRVVFQRGARELQFAGRGTGMNEGGIGLYVDAPVQPGDQVQVEVTPPCAGLKLRVRGIVRHAANRCGIEFLTAAEGERQEVALFRRMLRAAADRLGE